MHAELTDVPALAAELAASGARLVGIAGAPGAGKSTLAEALARETGGIVLPMDGFHLPQQRLVELGRRERMGAPDTFDVDGLIAVADQAGITLIELAMGFILSNPAITSLLLGPRTPQQLTDLVQAQHVVLSADVLAAIDAINPPGVTVNPYDNG